MSLYDLADVRDWIGRLVDNLGGDSFDDRLDKNRWRLTTSGLSGGICLVEDEENEDNSTLFVYFRVMNVPLQAALPFYRQLLEMNDTMVGRVAFSVTSDNEAHVQAGRSIRDIDRSEFQDLILFTIAVARSWRTDLLSEFGHEWALL